MMDEETRDCIRDLCLAVAILGWSTEQLIGTSNAANVIAAARRLSERMDLLDQQENSDG
jgi:hypothetical protein